MIRNVFFLAGTSSIGVGVGAYDWRAGLIATGFILLVFAAASLRRAKQ
jgi:hypothetical protein